jgi:hypothetical protein
VIETTRLVPTKSWAKWGQRGMDLRGRMHEYVRQTKVVIHATNQPYLAENYYRKLSLQMSKIKIARWRLLKVLLLDF